MRFMDFSLLCEQLEHISGRLDTIGTVSEVLYGIGDDELPVFVRFIMGRVFPDYSPLKLGIGPNLVYEAVAYVAGVKKAVVREKINALGDAGCAVEHLLATKEQTSFFKQDLDVVDIYRAFEQIAIAEGHGSQREKVRFVQMLYGNMQPLEGRYLTRLMLEELRIGMGEGNVRDAIAKAFSVDTVLVEHAHQAINDLGEVARLARQGPDALSDVKIELFRPVKMMLAQQGTISEMVAEHGRIMVEYKYDGSRFQFHKKGDECRMYSRKLEDVTVGLPDIVQLLKDATDHDVILDGEVIAIKEGRPMPFQFVIRRFRRKHKVDLMREQIALIPHVFDILYLDGETLIDLPLSERRERLSAALEDYIAPQYVGDSVTAAENIYAEALQAGHEGIMVKMPDSQYRPGVRGRQWVKVKPGVDTLDLAVIGAEWGEGRRAGLFGSFLLACQDQGQLLPVGKVATGLSDELLAELYEALKDRVIAQKGKEVTFEPGMVFEVGYSEIQTSPNYGSGFALRFPRFVRIRDDKSVDEIESLDLNRERHRRQYQSEEVG